MGRPARESSCECERNEELQLGVVLALVNGPTVNEAIGDEENAIAKLAQDMSSDRQLVDEMFLRFLNRPPTDDEADAALEIFQAIERQHRQLADQLRSLEEAQALRRTAEESQRSEQLKRARMELAQYQKRQAPLIARRNRERSERIAQATAVLEAYEDRQPARLRQWEHAHRETTSWTALDPIEVIADTQRTIFAIQPDKSIFVRGDQGRGAYRLLASTK